MNLHIRLEKKRIGSFYTPELLAEQIAEDTLCTWASKPLSGEVACLSDLDSLSPTEKTRVLAILRDIAVVDPAAGDGAFLLAAARWLEEARCRLDDTLSDLERRREIVERCLYGTDIVLDAALECRDALESWVAEIGYPEAPLAHNVRQGNALVGAVRAGQDVAQLEDPQPFNWSCEFRRVFHRKGGFDVVLGNPPYGNILSHAEREHIAETYPFNVGGGRTGTWNAASHFIVRAGMLLGERGSLGFLVPNSILRVTQFQKTREYLLRGLHLRKVVDEGNPFDGVTLEMVSLFCEKHQREGSDTVLVESRRRGHKQTNEVPREILSRARIFSIYHDGIHAEILAAGERNLLNATRGRDVPKNHVARSRSNRFCVPYITSGRSVKRYRIDPDYLHFADDWFLSDKALRFSYENELLVSTKNYRYPRCVLKPPGFIHGGGIVLITAPPQMDIRALGMILNSRLVRFVCERYLTNYSELTTCLNTGIMNELPMLIPEEQGVFRTIFDILSLLYSGGVQMDVDLVTFYESVSNALTYELFFAGEELQKSMAEMLSGEDEHPTHPRVLYSELNTARIRNTIRNIMKADHILSIEKQLGSDTDA
jgi:hypothetical protein